MSRPELIAPPEVFYNDAEARKYHTNSRIQQIQVQMTERALELLNLPQDEPAYVLDIGCGSGLSGDVLTEAGHTFVGVDISRDMLGVARENETEGDLYQRDIGHGLGLREAVFDGAISISAIQWLCNADKKSNVPHKRLMRFFNSLYKCLVRGARAVFQFYPQDDQQLTLITNCAMKCGFSGGLVVDYPNSTKAKKYFLCLFAGAPTNYELPQAKGVGEMDEEAEASGASASGSSQSRRRHREKSMKSKTKDWILNKKERQRRQGKEVRPDSKYTGRKRGPKF